MPASRRLRAGPVALAILLAVVLSGCAGRPPTPDAGSALPSSPAAEWGMATHYAARFAGRKTASGERYRPEAMTAAHRTLPFGTMVRVTRVDRDGATVAGPILVRINDRGPYGRGRVIDLSAAAARRLRMLGGIARVKIEVLGPPPPVTTRGP
jgi:rare lipoprotein A